MKEYIIATDVASDLPKEVIDKYEIKMFHLVPFLDGKDVRGISNIDFYNKMRSGSTSSTSAGNIADITDFFEGIISDEGKDILYIGFSSGLSSQSQTAAFVAEEINEKYGRQVVTVIDSLCACAGQGYLVHTALSNRENGMSLSENAEYIEKVKLNMCHWFTVGSLTYLKRGGRVSSFAALAGTILNIKPILKIDDNGKIIGHSKAKGRKGSLKDLCQKVKENIDYSYGKTVYIGHGDCIDDANAVADMIRQETDVDNVVIYEIGPVIGAHAGPDTIAIFFYGANR